MAVRASVIDHSSWDDQTLGQQEADIGRFKLSGASLDRADDPQETFSEPLFAGDQGNVTVPPAAHIRKANPRGPGASCGASSAAAIP